MGRLLHRKVMAYGGSTKKSGGEFSGSESVDIGSCKCKRSIVACEFRESSADERSLGLGANDVCVGDIIMS